MVLLQVGLCWVDGDFPTNAGSRHRALIFCQWKATVDLIARSLSDCRLASGVSFMRLDGSVPVGERQAVVERFNRDSSIDLLLSTTQVSENAG